MSLFLVRYNLTNQKVNVQKNVFLTGDEQLSNNLKNVLLKACVQNSDFQVHVVNVDLPKSLECASFLIERGGDGQFNYMIHGDLSSSDPIPSFSLESVSRMPISSVIREEDINGALNEIFSLDSGKFIFRKKTKMLDYDF